MGWCARLSVFGLYLGMVIPNAVSASSPIRFISLSTGETLTCGVAVSGTLYCWGEDEYILVEQGKSISLSIPTAIAPEVQFRSVSVGSSILCGIATSGNAYCWGQAMAASKPTLISTTLRFRSISSGISSACGITTDGEVFCWGQGYSHGADVAEFHKNVPVRIQANASFEVVSSSLGLDLACGIANDGAGYCWGQNLEVPAEPGAKSSNVVAVKVKGGGTYRTVSAGKGGALAVGRDGIVYLWKYEDLTSKALNLSVRFSTIEARGSSLCGIDTAGAGYCWGERIPFGSGTRGNSSIPQQVFGTLAFSVITVGSYHACGMTTEGRAYCWGNGRELGNGLPGSWSIPTPVANPDAKPIAEDETNGAVSFRSDLADPAQIEARLAERRELNSKQLVVMIEAKSGEQLVGSGAGVCFFAGFGRAYIVTAYHLIRPEQKLPLSIKVRFWSNPDHPLEAKVTGDWDRSLDIAILRVDGIDSLKLDLYSMPFHQVRRFSLEKGAPLFHLGNPGGRTWGSNVTPDRFLENRGPIAYFESSSIRPGVSGGALLDEQREIVGMIRADESGEGEAITWGTLKGRLQEWGYPVYLGSAQPAPSFVSTTVLDKLNYGITPDHAVYSWPEIRSDPAESTSLIGGLNLAEIKSDRREWGLGLCGLGNAGDAYCWTTPYSEPGQQVLGDPEKVTSDIRFRSLTVGGAVCGLASDDRAFCWGRSGLALGDGSIRSSNRPVAVYGNHKFKSISSGSRHTCAVEEDGGIYCWGENVNGDLGLPSALSFDLPTRVPSKLRFKSVSCGSDHTCAITDDGTAYCWGGNEYGQLGNGTNVESSSPVQVSASWKFQLISAGDRYACAVTTDSAAACWGLNDDGELGNNMFKNSSVPVAVAGGLQFRSVSAGYNRTIANTISGAAYTWGLQRRATDNTEVQHSAIPLPAPADSDLASIGPVHAYRMDGDFGKAEQAAEEAIQRYPNSASVVYNVARFFAEIGKSDRTRAGIQKLRDLGEGRLALLRIAQLELQIEALDAMATDLDRAEKLSKNDDEIREVRVLRADSYSNIGQYATADAEYQKLLSADPHLALVLNNLAYDLARENRTLQTAYDMATEAVASDPENSNYLDTLGFICVLMDRIPEAQKHLEHALANQGINDSDILEHLGDAYSKLGDVAGANEMWRSALQRREAEAPKLRQSAIIERIQRKLAAQPNSGPPSARK